MTEVKSKRGLKKHYEAAPEEVREYFSHLPGLLETFPLHVALAYVFSRVELAQNMAIYCGIVKRHKGDAALVRKAVDAHHMTRKDFAEKYKAVFGKAPSAFIGAAEKVRDKVMHGKNTTDKEVRQAIAKVLDYAQRLNAGVSSVAGFKPFGDLRGWLQGCGTVTRLINNPLVAQGHGVLDVIAAPLRMSMASVCSSLFLFAATTPTARYTPPMTSHLFVSTVQDLVPARRALKSAPVGFWKTRRSNSGITARMWSKMSAWIAS